MLRRLALVPLCLLACGRPEPGSDTGTSSDGGDESFGMGVTSDPTNPPPPATTEDTITTDPTIPTVPVPTTDFTTDPTAPSTITAFTDSSSDPSGFTDADPTFPETTTFSTSSETTFDPNCPDPPNQPQDAECTDASGCGCASGRCFLIPILGGFCGECLVDADCGEGGCTVPNPVDGSGSLCNKGEKGAGCMTDDACNDPSAATCAVVIEVPGILTVATCGECATNTDCPVQAPNCSPVFDIPGFTGTNICVADKSVPNNSGCSLADDGMGNPVGDKACASGHCGDAVIMGLVHMGVCGECNQNSDCMPGDTCSDPQVDLDIGVLIGAVCM